ncbi:MAG: putative fused inner/outer rane transporter [Ramlibacter sp.]|uniref:efflux transporter outer membrane subunit n=1 Tax=Ramlibacter sp. TaxID=1917967 RepID=UPI002611482F|nr:efflux transporter outer membrane subunit [Ramlibacter sp.]MDB5752914.1 putative fused inner/outer rane transporter [Ramlibacter sp.]
MSAIFKLSTAAAAVLLAGCSMMPKYERPQAPVPGAFPYAAATQGVPAADLGWQQFFAADARLRGLIATALRNNRDLRLAILNIEQARAQYDIRRADQLPTVGAAVGGSRAPGPGGSAVSSYTAGLAFSSWEIDFFGRIASLSEAALAQYLATEEGRKAAQASLVASVATVWLNLAADEELLALTEQTLATREESQRLVRLRFDNGASSEIDLRLAQSLSETARVTLAQVQRQRALDLNTLGLLIGEPVATDHRVGVTTASVQLPDLPAGVPSEVLARRPDVRQAEQQLVAANANIGAARAAFFPRISLTAGIGTASTELSGLFSGGAWGLTLAPQLLVPIFDAGRNRAGLASAQVGRAIAVAQYERSIQSAFREVADGLAGRATLSDQVRAQATVVEAESVRLRLSQLRYDAGISSQLDLLDAQRSLFGAQQALVQTRLLRLQNQVQLYRALGGGWTEAAAP